MCSTAKIIVLFILLVPFIGNSQESINDWKPFLENDDSVAVSNDTIYNYILFEDYPRLFSIQSPTMEGHFSMTYFYLSGNPYFTFSIDDKTVLEDGAQEKFYPDGTPLMTGHCTQSKQDGVFTFFHENGNIRSKTNWENGKQEGASKHFYKNGYVRLENSFLDGRKNGPEKAYWNNSKLKSEATYARNSMVGEYKVYNYDGDLALIQTYSSSGEFIKEEYQGDIKSSLSLHTARDKENVVQYLIFDQEENIFMNDVEIIQSNALDGRTRGLFLIQFFNFEFEETYSKKDIKKTKDFMAKHTFNNADFELISYTVKKKKKVVNVDFSGIVDGRYLLEGKQFVIGKECYTYLVGIDSKDSNVPASAKQILLDSFKLL